MLKKHKEQEKAKNLTGSTGIQTFDIKLIEYQII